ncbi:MAG TPA: methyl-accepting chemotaxis protein, partial [Rhodocyclaceae bacterium]|nr:methyl-accepting chemotaxis protein [Rhodocyclaceae bacterium]
FKDYSAAIGAILGNIQPLIVAKQASAKIFEQSEPLLVATNNLARGYQLSLSSKALYTITLIFTALLAIAVLSILAKLYLDDTRR